VPVVPIGGMGCAGSWSVDTVPAWQGFTPYIEDDLTVIALANRAGANPGRITQRIAGHYVPAPKPMPPKKNVDQ
jgi:hypothetical protein